MRKPAYQVRLSPEERQMLQEILSLGELSARKLRRAQVLLLADEGKPNQEIMQLTGLSEPAVIAIKKRFLTEGLSLKEKPRPGRKPRLDDSQVRLLLELVNTEAPEGRALWTMQLLADQLMQLDVLDSISDETVRRVLKKRRLKPGRKKPGNSQQPEPDDPNQSK